MSVASRPLPENPEELRAFAVALQASYRVLEDELYAKTLHIEKLKMQLTALRRARFGRSSEKLDREIEQLELAIGELEEGQAQSAAAPHGQTGWEGASSVSRRAPKITPVRRALPAHLPRERIDHPAACACPACGSTRLTCIGTDEREVLEYVPSHFKVIVHARPKMSCRDCETITQPPLPSLPIERGLAGPSLLAHVLVSKYCDHLPLHRQSVIYARDGVEIERSTMADWVGQMAFLLQPLAEALGAHVRAGEALHADDTPVPVLDPGRGQTKTGRLWVAVRDERSWGSPAPPAVYYQYAPDRKAERAEALLRGCRGYLHADAYSGFRNLYEPNAITGAAPLIEVGCWAQARRKIFEVHAATDSPRANESRALSLRRVAIYSASVYVVCACMSLLVSGEDGLIVLRAMQSFCSGTISVLMFVSVMATLPPGFARTIGLALFCFASTAPSALNASAGAFVTERWGWQGLYTSISPGA